ncbi:hypothetical protein N9A43_00880, partial [Candidatus Pelagibacter sp.]|nr:hypothetical protein [Candidatus Pelagibacter sp.]
KMPIEKINQIASVTNNNDLVFSQCFSAFDIYTSLLVITIKTITIMKAMKRLKMTILGRYLLTFLSYNCHKG